MRPVVMVVFGFMILSYQSTALADTRAEVDQTCPLCRTEFKAVLATSGTQFGQRLDLRPVGPIASPWLLAVCPKCGFVLFKDEGENGASPPEELKALRAIVNSTEYTKLAPKDPSYLRLAKLYEGIRRPPYEIANAYLQASWQVEDQGDKRRQLALLGTSLQWLEKSLAASSERDEAWRTTEFLKGELLRRLGKVAEAKQQFDRLKGMEEFKAEPFPRLLAQEERLIRAGDQSPQVMDQGETFPVATEGTIHINGDEAVQLPGLADAGAVSEDSIVLVADIPEAYRKILLSYRQAADAGDSKAMDRLIEQGQAFRVKEGTRVVVRESLPRTTSWKAGLPSDPDGVRKVRILDGKSKGREGLVPARNLKPSASPAQE